MGYRSQVHCVIYGDPDKICALVAATTLAGDGVNPLVAFAKDITRYRATQSHYNHEATHAREPNINGVRLPLYDERPIEIIKLYGDDWKWCPDYPDVQSWEALMDRAAAMELSVEFVRLGEERSDVEERQHNVDDDPLLCVSRRVDVELPDDAQEITD